MITIFNAKDFTQKLKATIQRTGKMGFTAETQTALGLNEKMSILIGQDSENKKSFFMGVMRERIEGAFSVNKAGNYFYLNTTQLFDSLGIDYKRKNIMFDLQRAEELDEEMHSECYKMNMRQTERPAERPATEAE